MTTTIDTSSLVRASIRKAMMFPEKRYITIGALSNIMGVPQVAIRAIARQNCVEIIEDSRGKWIDADLLSGFADAYENKLKCYFKTCRHSYDKLSFEEERIFLEFCNTFKKQYLQSDYALVWDDIDKDAIREHFWFNVRKNTTSKGSSLSRLFSLEIERKLCSVAFSTIIIRGFEDWNNDKNHWDKQETALLEVTQSEVYQCKLPESKPVKKSQTCNVLRQCFVAAHYHIHVSSGKEDHHSKRTVILMRLGAMKNNNSAVRMVA